MSLSDEYKFILIIYRGFACNLTMGVFHVEMGSNRVYTMRVRGEDNIRDTALICQLKLILCCFAHWFSALPNSAEFCKILRNSAEIQDFR
jgi:hypothetical protein